MDEVGAGMRAVGARRGSEAGDGLIAMVTPSRKLYVFGAPGNPL
jgi:hypothetical protein